MATKHGARRWAETPDDPSKILAGDDDYIVILNADDELVYDNSRRELPLQSFSSKM